MDHARERGGSSPNNIEGKGHMLSNPILVPDGVHLNKSWDPGGGGGGGGGEISKGILPTSLAELIHYVF